MASHVGIYISKETGEITHIVHVKADDPNHITTDDDFKSHDNASECLRINVSRTAFAENPPVNFDGKTRFLALSKVIATDVAKLDSAVASKMQARVQTAETLIVVRKAAYDAERAALQPITKLPVIGDLLK